MGWNRWFSLVDNLFFLKSYLFTLEVRVTEREVSHPLFAPQMSAEAGSGPGQRQEPQGSSGSPTWVQGAMHLGRLPLLFPGH